MKKYKIFFSLFVVFAIFFGTFCQSSAATQEELQKLIETLQSQIKYLQQQLSQLIAQQSKSCPFVTVGLSKGYFDEPTSEVKELQKLLKQDKSIYPEGLVTGYFGRLTEAALKRFQQKYNLPPTGIVDEATQKKLCEVYLSRYPIPPVATTIPPVATTVPELLQVQCISEAENKTYHYGDSTTYVINQGVVFSARVTGGSPPYSYSWSGSVPANTERIITSFSTKGDYEEKITVADSLGKIANDTCKIAVKDLPKLEISNLTPLVVKKGQATNFNYTASNQGVENIEGISAPVYINGSLWYDPPSFNLNIGETKTLNFSWICNQEGSYKFNVGNYKTYTVICESVSVERPDLVITDVSITPVNPKVGENVSFVITERNIGAISAGIHDIQLMKQEEGGQTGTFEKMPEIAAGHSANTSILTFKELCQYGGQIFTFIATADPENYIQESNESNNQKKFTVTCSTLPPAKPDLVISELHADKTTLSVGETAKITATVKNIGNASAGRHKSVIMPLTFGIGITEGSSVTDTLAAGYGYLLVGYAKCEQVGTYQIRALTDALGEVTEANESNNYQTISITCSSPSLSDLIITNIQITPTNPKVGDYVNFVITEKNIGNATVDRHYIGWYQNNSLMGSSLVYGLAPNATTNYSFSLKYAEAGTYAIKAKADVYDEITESSEANNEKTGSLVISSAYIYPSQTGCIKSPAYNGDLCSGYRLITSLEHSAACYSLDQCLAVQGNGTCVKSPVFVGDGCNGYRVMSGISRACYSYSECQSALNNPVSSNLLENIQSQLALIEETIKKLMASLANSVSR